MNQTNTAIQNLLVIDSQVTDWQSLAAGVGADTAVLILDSGADGLTQLSDYLSNASTQGLPLLQSIQIISHGSAGSLQLGSSTVTKSNLSLYTKQLAKIGSSLTDTGDILLYGCNLAAGQAGLDFIYQFAALSNADVAASNDVTGSAALNGNWQLEANTGAIEVSSALTSSAAINYVGILAINTPPQLPVITPSNINGTLSAADAINPFNAGNYFDTYTPTGFINGTAMSLALNSTAFDTYLQIIRNGSVFAFNDDSNGTTNSLIDYIYQAGDIIYTTSSGGLATGAYSLNITGITIPALEVLTTLENTPITLTTTMLPITDLEQRPDQLIYTLASLPLKGILSKVGVTLVAGDTFTQADVDNGLILLTPSANANGTDSFTFSVADGLGGVLANQTFVINITPVNDAPTLTTFAAAIASGNEDNPISVTFANLQAQGNEADIDGTVTAFVIKGVSTGSLKIGTSAATSTDWITGSNDVIDDAHLAYWTPDANANGILNAITAVAKDNSGLESVTPVQATVSVAEVPDVTAIAAVTPIEGGVAGAFKINLDSPAPVGGLTINYSLSGSAILNTDYTVTAGTNIIAATAGSFTIAAGQTTARLTINAGNDGIADPNETINFYLNYGVNYQALSYEVNFDPLVYVGTQNNFRSVSIADFNGDGKVDLAIVDASKNLVSLFLRNVSNTGYESKVDFVTGQGPTSISAGDFNGDGKLDLAVTNIFSDTVCILLRNIVNTGFDSKIDYATGLNPESLSVADFNGDGRLDLVVGNYGSNTASVLLRNITNTGFDSKIDYITGLNPESVGVGDFNGDGKIDLAVANVNSSTVSVLLRNATNTDFEPQFDLATGFGPRSVSVGDFNGDGKADLAVVTSAGGIVSVFLRNAANTGFDPITNLTTGQNPLEVSTGDFNGDGRLDLAVANYWGKTISILLRNTTNTGFEPKVDMGTGSGYSSPWSVSVGDVNSDGKQDLVTVNGGGNIFSVLLNKTNPTTNLNIIDHNPANIAPTLTTFASPVASGNEDSQITISFANLQAQGNEADVDGTVSAFVIKAVSTGSLFIGTSALKATVWNALSNNIVDATHQAYWTPTTNANGTLNAFTVVAKDNGGLESASAIQAQISVANINDSPTGTVSITGVVTQGHQLTASNNLADADGMGTVSYTWYASGSVNAIGTDSTFTLTQAQVGKTISAVASYTDLLGTAESVSSSATGTVANVNDLPTGTVSISGIAIQGQQLTASNNLLDADGMGIVTYTWYASGSALSIGSGSMFTLTQAQVGKTISAVASYTDLLGTAESVSSSVTGTVANVNDLPTGSVSISGVATQGQQVTASNNLIDADGLGPVSYTWYTSGSALSIGTGTTFTLTQAQVGKTISAVASYTDLLGTAESVSSAAVAILVTPPQTFVSTPANETFTGITSNDTVSYINARAGVKVSLLSSLAQNNVASGMGIDTLGSIANLIGSGFNDKLTGNAKNNVLTGGAGADVLIGGGGKDTYIVGIKATGLLEDTVTGNTGIDTIQVVGNSANTTVAILKVAPIIENLDISGTGTSKLNITGNVLANILTGNAGNNLLNGGIGADSLIGGAGNDSYTVDNANDVVTEKTAEGIDLINSSVSYQLSANVENLTLTGKTAINASGNTDNNLLTGNAGMNSLSGNEGIDTLLGLAGNDSLNGGNGNDLLRGGAGNDRLTGGEGVDTFWFDTATNAKTNKDTLTDFVSGTDKLQFSVSVLKALGAVGQFTATDQRFWSSATGLAHDATDRLIYNTATGALSYDNNGNVAGGAVIIEVLGTATHPALAVQDIWVA